MTAWGWFGPTQPVIVKPDRSVTFVAPCPSCGGDAEWRQATGNVTPEAFTITCAGCVAVEVAS